MFISKCFLFEIWGHYTFVLAKRSNPLTKHMLAQVKKLS